MAPTLVATLALAALASALPLATARTFQGHLASSAERPERVLSPRPEDYLEDHLLPRHFDWRNVEGTNFVTSDVNQHIPQYCGSCWVHGTVAALNDRIKIQRGAAFPDVMLSRQAIVNCALNDSDVAPGCNGGEPWYIFKLMADRSMPDETCQPYQARNMECNPLCTNCDATLGTCFPLKSFVGYKVEEYGRVTGEKNMMKEIYERGPITCSYAATDEFVYNYTANANANAGVFVDDTQYSPDKVDHDIEVVGWDVSEETGVEYWIARNSWGTYWGENGWFRIKKGTLFFEEDCWWATPVYSDLVDYLDKGKYMGSYNNGLVMQKRRDRFDHKPKQCQRFHPATAAF